MKDKITIGPTQESAKVLSQLMESSFFAREYDAAKFAMALAINRGVSPDGADISTDTKWNMGSFDRSGELRALVSTLYPETETPVRLIEQLINAGFGIIGEHMAEHGGDVDIVALMKMQDAGNLSALE